MLDSTITYWPFFWSCPQRKCDSTQHTSGLCKAESNNKYRYEFYIQCNLPKFNYYHTYQKNTPENYNNECKCGYSGYYGCYYPNRKPDTISWILGHTEPDSIDSTTITCYTNPCHSSYKVCHSSDVDGNVTKINDNSNLLQMRCETSLTDYDSRITKGIKFYDNYYYNNFYMYEFRNDYRTQIIITREWIRLIGFGENKYYLEHVVCPIILNAQELYLPPKFECHENQTIMTIKMKCDINFNTYIYGLFFYIAFRETLEIGKCGFNDSRIWNYDTCEITCNFTVDGRESQIFDSLEIWGYWADGNGDCRITSSPHSKYLHSYKGDDIWIRNVSNKILLPKIVRSNFPNDHWNRLTCPPVPEIYINLNELFLNYTNYYFIARCIVGSRVRIKKEMNFYIHFTSQTQDPMNENEFIINEKIKAYCTIPIGTYYRYKNLDISCYFYTSPDENILVNYGYITTRINHNYNNYKEPSTYVQYNEGEGWHRNVIHLVGFIGKWIFRNKFTMTQSCTISSTLGYFNFKLRGNVYRTVNTTQKIKVNLRSQSLICTINPVDKSSTAEIDCKIDLIENKRTNTYSEIYIKELFPFLFAYSYSSDQNCYTNINNYYSSISSNYIFTKQSIEELNCTSTYMEFQMFGTGISNINLEDNRNTFNVTFYDSNKIDCYVIWNNTLKRNEFLCRLTRNNLLDYEIIINNQKSRAYYYTYKDEKVTEYMSLN